MTKYSVRVPFAGYVDVDVEADSPDEAAEAALDNFPELALPESHKYTEWGYEPMQQLVQGNICFADETEMSMYDLDADEEVDWSPRRFR